MLHIALTAEAVARLQALLDKEGDSSCLRLREMRYGCA